MKRTGYCVCTIRDIGCQLRAVAVGGRVTENGPHDSPAVARNICYKGTAAPKIPNHAERLASTDAVLGFLAARGKHFGVTEVDPTFLITVLFLVAISSDFARILFELTVNLRHRRRRSQAIRLDTSEAVVVIPCHDSEDSIEKTLESLPPDYTVYCVVNNCTDRTLPLLRSLQTTNPKVVVLEVEFEEKSKSRAAVLGAVEAQRAGFTHLALLDDDVLWPAGTPIEVLDRADAVTALPILPSRPVRVLEGLQVLEYVSSSLNKRCQMFFANDVTFAAGAAAIYRCDTYLDVMRFHDGLFAGEDVQCSYLHHLLGYRVSFLPETIAITEIPNDFAGWWKQRANCWDISFMFLHLGLLLRVLLLPPGRGPGGWIRVLTFYRIYDALLVFSKCLLPLVLYHLPVMLPIFLASAYTQLGFQYGPYSLFFPPLRRSWGRRSGRVMASALLIFPFYQVLTWFSRLSALPKSIYLRIRYRETIEAFVTRNFDACTLARIHFPDGKRAALRPSESP